MNELIITINVAGSRFKLGVFKTKVAGRHLHHLCWCDHTGSVPNPLNHFAIKTYEDFESTQLYAFAFRDGYESAVKHFGNS